MVEGAREVAATHKARAWSRGDSGWRAGVNRAQPAVPLDAHGIVGARNVHWHSPVAMLYEAALDRQEAQLSEMGALVVTTGHHTGRSPRDKFIVKEPSTEQQVAWGAVNQPFAPEHWHALHQRVAAHLAQQELFVQDCYAGAATTGRLPLRVVTEYAWCALFARNLFRRVEDARMLPIHQPGFTVLHAPNFNADPQRDGTRSATFIIVNLAERMVLIGGTHYAGEIKKSIFGVLTYLLPQQGIVPMHCSANRALDGAGVADNADPSPDVRAQNVALYFGLSGTGKTTLSTDPARILIGDDEHAWNDDGIFNLEGGCYAKTIRLSPEAEPEIYAATQRFGTILENVGFSPQTRLVDLDDDSLTENTRAAYPIAHIAHATPSGLGAHPRNIFFLTCDAFGVLPPLARLNYEQARAHFLAGYTAKVAGTEQGVTKPTATFSACFGEPFMALPPMRYAQMLGERVRRHNVQVWLVNTGWIGGPYGVGERIPIKYTRALIHAVLAGALDDVATQVDPIFGLAIPVACPDVPTHLLNPRASWTDGAAYDAKAADLAARFAANARRFEAAV